MNTIRTSEATLANGPKPRTPERAGTAANPFAITPTRLNAGLAVLRVIVGTIFLAHGAQKLFVFGIPGLIEGFGGMGVPLASVAAPAVALLEFLGGIALIVGLFTPVIAFGLAAVMLGAMLMVHLPAGFFAPNGVEFVLSLFAAAVALGLVGPGAWSLDAVLARRRSPA